MGNRYEVELKFRVEQLDSIRQKLKTLGGNSREHVSHRDRYFNHPSRDFRATDEAFRIRSVGEVNCVTYKGAVLGSVAKTRHEIEVEFGKGDRTVEQLIEMVTLLGFRFVREVRKFRQLVEIHQNDHTFHIALDDVPGLGQFVEIEVMAEDEDRERAETAVWNLAGLLGLATLERRSYLDLLVESDGPKQSERLSEPN